MLDALRNDINKTIPEKRTKLLKFVASYCLEEQQRLETAELDLLAAVAETLFERVDKDTLIEAAQTFAAIDTTPRSLLRKFAESEIKVASPVLTQAKGLTNEDLNDLAKTQSEKHRQAIAIRENIQTLVTDTLINLGDARTLMLVIRNKTAEISENSFLSLADKAQKNQLLGEALSFRGDMPVGIADPLLETGMKTNSQMRLVGQIETTQKVSIAGVKQREQMLERAKLKYSAGALKFIDAIDAGKTSLSGAIASLGQKNQAREIAELMAWAGKMTEKAVNDSMYRVSGQQIADLCMSLGLDRDAFLAVTNARIKKLRLPPAQAEQLARQYDVMLSTR